MNAKQRKEAVRQEAIQKLREILKPGDEIVSILRSVSRSGMSRHISFFKRDGMRDLGALISDIGDYKWNGDGSLTVSGCGMDMGFHVTHNLGYALYGDEAQHGTTPDAIALRRALLANDPHYYTQMGQKAPDPKKPGREWFGGTGYAFKHRWL